MKMRNYVADFAIVASANIQSHHSLGYSLRQVNHLCLPNFARTYIYPTRAMITTETIFWTQIASITGFVVALFFLYRLLVDQKEATIQLQKENIAFLKDQLTDAKLQSPDVLAQSLAGRVKLFEEELERLGQDKTTTEEQIAAKEAELSQARGEAEALTKKVLQARELLHDYLCPHCGAPLIERAYHSEMVEYQGRELDVDHDWSSFECGLEITDGLERHPCKTKKFSHANKDA
jgi:predicted RNA-binding Zn-ribbon protein involved in translation (DUF1610 family)